MNKPHTIIIGGKAGEGVKKAAQVVATTIGRLGYHVFQTDDYQSLIKGGHNFSTISFATKPVYNCYNQADLLISFDKRSLETHLNDVTDCNSLHCYNIDDGDSDLINGNDNQSKTLGFPFTRLMNQIYTSPANVSMAAIALAFVWMGLEQDFLEETIRKEFKRNVEENVRYAIEIYKLGEAAGIYDLGSLQYSNTPSQNSHFASGNQAIALGAWLGGLDFYYAYPMTPASSILHYLALKQSTHKVYAIHAESELAAANMAIGSVVAGTRTAIGSSGGGFALMQEAFSLAGMAEAPLLCILASRPGPATGVSTYTAQEDLPFALAQGHGEFGRVVAAPDSVERAFTLAAELLSLAWEFQSPVILLSDKHLSESSCNVVYPDDVPFANPEPGTPDATYNRYQITDNGISPLLFPGTDFVDDETVIKWNSHEHLPSGLRTDKADAMIAMKDKRNRKSVALSETTNRYKRVCIYGNQGSPVFAYGSAVLELREAQKHCSIPFTIVSLIYLKPFPLQELIKYQNEEVIVFEHSSTGNLAQYLSQNLQINLKASILRYDGRVFDPLELAAKLEEVLNA